MRWNRYLAEAFGTFCLVFAGCGAIVVNSMTDGAVTHVGVSLVFGLIVCAMIYSIGNISGAHINPAVTVGFFCARRITWKHAGGYVIAQLLGGLLAAMLLWAIFPDSGAYGPTVVHPDFAPWQALVLEGVLTFILMAVILNVSTGHMEKGIMAGVAVGGVIALEALFGGPISGGSMNPARSLSPAFVSGVWTDQWIYVVGPVAGAILAAPTCRIIQGDHCCPSPLDDEKQEQTESP